MEQFTWRGRHFDNLVLVNLSYGSGLTWDSRRFEPSSYTFSIRGKNAWCFPSLYLHDIGDLSITAMWPKLTTHRVSPEFLVCQAVNLSIIFITLPSTHIPNNNPEYCTWTSNPQTAAAVSAAGYISSARWQDHWRKDKFPLNSHLIGTSSFLSPFSVIHYFIF